MSALEILISLIFFSFAGSVILGHTYFYGKSLMSGLEKLAPALESPQIQGPRNPRLLGKYKGMSIRVQILNSQSSANYNSNSTASLFSIAILWPTHYTLRISKEELLHKIFKPLGVMQDIRIGIPAFDEQFLITSNNDSDVRKLLADTSIRTAIEFLFSRQMIFLEIGNGAVVAGASDYRQYLEPSVLTGLLDRMIKITYAV